MKLRKLITEESEEVVLNAINKNRIIALQDLLKHNHFQIDNLRIRFRRGIAYYLYGTLNTVNYSIYFNNKNLEVSIENLPNEESSNYIKTIPYTEKGVQELFTWIDNINTYCNAYLAMKSARKNIKM